MNKDLIKNFKKILESQYSNGILKIGDTVFKKARTKKELNVVYRVRYEIYLDEGYIEENKKKIFKDKYDLYSLNFLVFKQNNPIATYRLVLNSNTGLPAENLCNFEQPNYPGDQLAEVGRLAIKKGFRGGDRIITMGMIKIIFYYANELKIQGIYAGMPNKLQKYYSSLGIKFKQLKEFPLNSRNLKERKSLKKYFKKTSAKPYLIDIEETHKKLLK